MLLLLFTFFFACSVHLNSEAFHSIAFLLRFAIVAFVVQWYLDKKRCEKSKKVALNFGRSIDLPPEFSKVVNIFTTEKKQQKRWTSEYKIAIHSVFSPLLLFKHKIASYWEPECVIYFLFVCHCAIFISAKTAAKHS